MLHGFVLIVVFQYAGEAAARLLGLPTPGPVVGLAALALIAIAWPSLFRIAEPTADALLRHLSLLFVPAGVGVLQHLDLLRAELVPLVAVLVLSTLITMAVTAGVFAALARPAGEGGGPMSAPADFWVYLATSPLFWLALTLSVYLGADKLSALSGRNSFVNPVLIAIVALGAVLIATGTSYETISRARKFVHVLLGPATVALRSRSCATARRSGQRASLLVAFVVGVVGIASAVGSPAFGLDPASSPRSRRSFTAPTPWARAELGGVPELTPLVIATGSRAPLGDADANCCVSRTGPRLRGACRPRHRLRERSR